MKENYDKAEFTDADGCYAATVEILGETETMALVRFILPIDKLVVRKSDLIMYKDEDVLSHTKE